jgi:primosomal protein N' (replication factor Y)
VGQLNQRYGKVELPEIQTVDLKLAHQKKQVKGGFSHTLIQEMEQTLAMGKQIIAFSKSTGVRSSHGVFRLWPYAPVPSM